MKKIAPKYKIIFLSSRILNYAPGVKDNTYKARADSIRQCVVLAKSLGEISSSYEKYFATFHIKYII